MRATAQGMLTYTEDRIDKKRLVMEEAPVQGYDVTPHDVSMSPPMPRRRGRMRAVSLERVIAAQARSWILRYGVGLVLVTLTRDRLLYIPAERIADGALVAAIRTTWERKWVPVYIDDGDGRIIPYPVPLHVSEGEA